ncbi:cupin domain-containing protein [Spirochaetota bacterium]
MENTKNDSTEYLKEGITLEELVSYQGNSVVSKALINRPVGTVTLFAFGKGEGLSEHSAPYDALVYIMDGEAKITISGKPFNIKKGEMIIMPANDPHALEAITEF